MIYFDNAATTKPDINCLKSAEKYLIEEYYNPSALYAEGYNLNRELKAARSKILSLVTDTDDFSLIFTSSGTEADNLAVFGGGKRGNIVTTLGEHAAVYESANELKMRGFDVRFANLRSDGSVDIEHLLSLIDDKTSLVSVIHVNSETGAINDIAEIARMIKKKNKLTLFHSDGVQAFGKLVFKLTQDIDLYSISAHKIGGIKGCGALIKKKNLIIKPHIFGGGQENGLRSGTENVFGIKCFEFAAVSRYNNVKENFIKTAKLNSLFKERLDKYLFDIISGETASPYILTIAARGVRGETILHEANDKGLIIGTGSACSSNHKRRYSRIILACGADNLTADGILRISFAPENTREKVIEATTILNELVKNRKEMMG